MKKSTFLLILVLTLFFSCSKSYLEYTLGIKELNYSFDENIKRYSNLERALKTPLTVRFLDINLKKTKNPDETLKKLNKNIEQLVNLKKLTITSNRNEINYFPENIFNCNSLEFLVFQEFKNFNPVYLDSLPKLNKLVFLALNASDIKTIPNSVLELNKLEGLDLTANGITTIPKEIKKLKSLKTLDLTNNCFSEFPSELKGCESLEILDLNNAEGMDADQLKFLGCCHNTMSNFDSLSELKKIKTVSLFMVITNEEKKRLQKDYPNIEFK